MKIGSTKGFITQPFKKGNKFKKKDHGKHQIHMQKKPKINIIIKIS